MSELTIAQLTTTVFRLPMHGSLRWGKASALNEARHVLVQVTLSDGSIGLAEAPPRPTIYGETVYSITSVIEHELAPRLINTPLSKIQNRLHEVKNNHTAKGALDMALHEAIAQSKGIPLAEQLGYGPERLQSKLKVSYILGIGDQATVLAEAQRVYEQGVRVLKVKVGREWAADLANIHALQALFGDKMALYADANECLAVDEAAWKLRHLRQLGLLYCEEPLPVELIRERAALQRQQALPVIADDSCFTLRDLQRELAFDTFDILNIKSARTGFSESLQMLQAAQQAGKGVMLGSQASAGLGTAHAALLAALPGVDYPSELSFPLKLKEDIVTPTVLIVDGYMTLADVCAVRVDADLLRSAMVS